MQTPYGSWHSPIDSTLITSGTIGLGHPVVTGAGERWIESRPSEGGRNVIVGRDLAGNVSDYSPAEVNVRSRVHEYGGGAWTASGDRLWFINDHDQRIYQQDSRQPAKAVSGTGTQRYADLQSSPDGSSLIAIREQTEAGGGEPISTLIMLDLDGSGRETTIAAGADFYASARFSADGRRIAWLSWDHPNMPWDQTTLWVADLLGGGQMSAPFKIAGGAGESLFQPQWGPNGELYVVSDRSGWWNLYSHTNGELYALLPMEAEFGLPQWVFGMSTYGITSDGELLCSYTQAGRWQLGLLNPNRGDWRVLALDYSDMADIHVHNQQALMVAASPQRPPAIVSLDLKQLRTTDSHTRPAQRLSVPEQALRILRSSMASSPNPAYLSEPESINYPSVRGEIAHALYYPPKNQDHQPIAGERPPLLVRSHGGPTAAASTAFNPSIQFWTSRGFAVLDVNYGGSTGYGRRYRERLDGRWGETDVDDCIYGARHLIDQGLADPSRCAIRGSSAGGYTTLAALTFRTLFRAGASLYGISDLEALVTDTHKFESRYLDKLIGPYPEQRQTYYQRSPIHFPEQLSCPIIFLQGLQDKVVPPAQAEAMVQALRNQGLPVAYLSFANEQHGFRDGATIKIALEAELYFYARIFDFAPADKLPGCAIDNLDPP